VVGVGVILDEESRWRRRNNMLCLGGSDDSS